MIINESTVLMTGRRDYKSMTSEKTSVKSITQNPKKQEVSFMKMLGFKGNYSLEDVGATKKLEGEKLSEKDNLKMQVKTINYLLRLLLYKRAGGSNETMEEVMNQYEAVSPTNYYANYSSTSSYYEMEKTSFKTTGTVVTADGREINFGVDVSMSREFYSQTTTNFSTNLQYIDPLVINLDSNPTSVSDLKFEFDLDCDGKKENISILNKGTGFLALDKNENGEIDDGSELFGTSSQDGFRDLAEYDLDGNGWIDEADDIFDKLKIWQVNEDGSKNLYTLKEKGVGAICLKNVNTQFSLNDENNNTNACVRKSGVFLFENGKSGTLSHIDMVS